MYLLCSFLTILFHIKIKSWLHQNSRIFSSFSLSLYFIRTRSHPIQQGHSAAFYRDHPQDIRHRTIQSRKPPPLSTHLMKGDPDSATSPSKYTKNTRPTPVLPPPDVTINIPVTEIQRIRVIESLREEDFEGLLDLTLYRGMEKNDPRRNKVPPSKEDALRLALNRRGVRVDRNLSVADDDEEDKEMSRNRKIAATALNNSPSKNKIGSRNTAMANTTMTTSDSEDEVARPTRRKPRKKKRDKPDASPDKSPTRRPKLSINREEGVISDDEKEEKSKVDGYILAQWKGKEEKKYKRDRTKSSSQAQDENEMKVQMQKLLHRSRTGFCIDDVKNALENAKVMGKSDQDLDDMMSSDEINKNLTGQALIDHKKKLALKWERMTQKIMTQETLVGEHDVDKALLAAKFSKLGNSLPEVDESNIAERTKHIMSNGNNTNTKKPKSPTRRPAVPLKPLKSEPRNRTLVPAHEPKPRLTSPSKNERTLSRPGTNQTPSTKKRINKASKSQPQTRPTADPDQHYEDADFGTTPKLPPLRDGTGQTKTEETDGESTKRLELIKAARSARPIPIGPSPPSGIGPGKNKKTQNTKNAGKVHLPLTTKKPKKKMPGEEDADQEFYKAFKLLFVDLPEPEDDLPCEY